MLAFAIVKAKNETMAKQIGYELNANGTLEVIVSPKILDKARQLDPTLAPRLEEYKRREYLPAIGDYTEDDFLWRYVLKPKVIGRMVNFNKKLEAVEGVTDALGTLICRAPEPDEDNERLSFPGFLLGRGDFGFHAQVSLPDAQPNLVASFVKSRMVRMCRDLQLLEVDVDDQIYEDQADVDYDHVRGVNLCLSADSKVFTAADDYTPWSNRVELSGNNVSNYVDPLVYLAGSIALAYADTYLDQLAEI